MESAPVDQEHRRAQFPALDPEPRRRSLWRVLLGPVITVALVGAVVAGVSFGPSILHAIQTGAQTHRSASSHRSGSAQLSALTSYGRILSESSQGYLDLTNPNGTDAVALHKPGQFAPYGIVPSSDGHFLASSNQQLFAVSRDGVSALPFQANLTSVYAPAIPSPFSDHDRFLVMTNTFFGEQAFVHTKLVSPSTGQQISLGQWNSAAGDPQAPGAFVVKAIAVGRKSKGNFANVPDSRLELLDAGHKPVVLATVARLNKILGLSANVGESISVYPDPSGDKVAVETMMTGGYTSLGVVVLNRTGKVLQTLPLSLGVLSRPFWSPSGRSFAAVTTGTGGWLLGVWTIGGSSQTTNFPYNGRQYDRCVWSPNDAGILCSDNGGQHWVLAQAAGGTMTTEPGRGFPLAWVP